VKAYLVTTGTLFGLMAVMNLVYLIHDSSRLVTDPWHYLENSALGVVPAVLSMWAWRLLRLQGRS
jgi:hypothetical protein